MPSTRALAIGTRPVARARTSRSRIRRRQDGPHDGGRDGAAVSTDRPSAARHLQNHIPGRLVVVVITCRVRGLQMANNLFNSGARDGTVIGARLNGTPTVRLMQPRPSRLDRRGDLDLQHVSLEQCRLCLAHLVVERLGS